MDIATRFSLILATVDRVTEVERCLRSLATQTYKKFEVIVVDQNDDDRLLPLVRSMEGHMCVRHVRAERGLSRARNVGLQIMLGDVVAFPDDDCWYPADTLAKVSRLLSENPSMDGLTGRSIGENGETTQLQFPDSPRDIDKMSVWSLGISYTIFLRASIARRVGDFDETLGVGAGTAFGSGEETDYLLRACQLGAALRYAPEVAVHHPAVDVSLDAACLNKAYRYACGMGRVVGKHHYPLWFKAKVLLRACGGALIALISGSVPQARYHWVRARGRWVGLTTSGRAAGRGAPGARGTSC